MLQATGLVVGGPTNVRNCPRDFFANTRSSVLHDAPDAHNPGSSIGMHFGRAYPAVGATTAASIPVLQTNNAVREVRITMTG